MALENLRSIFQDQLADRAEDFVSQTPSHFNATTPIYDLLTTTNVVNITQTFTATAFPTNYIPLHEIINNEFVQKEENQLKNHTWADLYFADHRSRDNITPDPNNPFQPFTYKNSGELDIRKNRGKQSPYTLSRTSFFIL